MVFYRMQKSPSKVLTVQISDFGEKRYRAYIESVDMSNVECPFCLKAVEVRFCSDLVDSIIDRTKEAKGQLRTNTYYKNLGHPFNMEEFDKNEWGEVKLKAKNARQQRKV